MGSPADEDSSRPGVNRRPIDVVVHQHVEECVHLRNVRSTLVRAPHSRLLHLARLDERIAAHLDGISVAGERGSVLSHQALEPPSVGAVFAATVHAIESHDAERLHKMLTVGRATPEGRRGVLSAFGWVSASSLRGITKGLLDSPAPWQQEVGLASCAMHHVDPGAGMLRRTIRDAIDPALAVRALRTAGEIGRHDLLDACAEKIQACHDSPVLFAAARAAVLLGDRSEGVASLHRLATAPGTARDVALGLLLKLAAPTDLPVLLQTLSGESRMVRTLIRAIGIAGDPHYVPWLIARIDDLTLARLAGESFSLITGLDLAYRDLDRKPPEGVDSGPTADPEDSDVAIDEDDSLPWPDPEKITAWWKANGARFAAGTRYFMAESPSPTHCLSVLQTGFQRQRRHAAEYLCLLKPGTPLFNIAAPAWRQKRLLAQRAGA